MKNKKKMIISFTAIIILVLGVFIYQRFIKKQLHFKEQLTVEINEKFDPMSFIEQVDHGNMKDVTCQSKNINIKKLGQYEIIYTYKNRDYTKTVQVIDTKKPEFKGLDDLTISLNTIPDLNAGVEVTDNSLEDIKFFT